MPFNSDAPNVHPGYRPIPKGSYLILGSTGLVGSHALLALKDQPGVNIRATYNRRQPHIFADNITYVSAELMDRDACRQTVQDIDYVLMFAGVLSTAPVIAKNPIDPVLTNLIITSQCLESAYNANVKKFVWLSSTTGYPPLEEKLTEDQMFEGDPPDVYYPVGWMTRYLETQCKMYSEKLKRQMNTIALRPTMIFGEYDDFEYESAHFLPALIRRVVERQKPIEVWGTGEQTRDAVYASDVVDASLRAIERIDRFEAFNVAYGHSYSVNDLLAKIISIDGFTDAEIVHVFSRPTTISNRAFGNQKARDMLGFEPKTSIDEGLKLTINWYRKTHQAVAR